MDEWTLNDLLECSVCLERLDTSSKVLPCQHTFCKKCLEEILSTHKELRCPECRVLVDAKIDELPPNVLLMRILEGMRNAAPKKKNATLNRLLDGSHPPATIQQQPVVQYQMTAATTTVSTDIRTNVQPLPKQHVQPNLPYARALYDYHSKEPGDLSFKKGDIILLRKKIDANWYYGENAGIFGVFPLTYVQVMTQLPSHIPQCRALYDFVEEGCLSFNKGEVITVIRRVDENWAEGKLAERIGIFPLSFVELNSVARALMKLSMNSQPGPSRLAPPTPTSEDTTPLIPTDHSRTISSLHLHQQSTAAATMQQPPPAPPTSDSSSTVSSASSSTTTPNTSSSNTSSSSSTAPSSPTSPPPPRMATSPPPHGVIAPPPPRPMHNPSLSVTSPSQVAQQRDKRHSFSVLHSGHHHQTSHRHSAEILSPTEPASQETSTLEHSPQLHTNAVTDLVQRQGSQRHRRTSSNDLNASGPPPPPVQGLHAIPGSTSHLPAAYIALYTYKPQKADELELRKGGMYMVTERCQDGWFKGTSNRTLKCGVFPGNYVAPAKAFPGLHTYLRSQGCSSTAANITSPRSNGTPPQEPRSYTRNKQNPATLPYSPKQHPHMTADLLCATSQVPPELPPRSVSPGQAGSTVISSSWHGQNPQADGGCSASSATPLGRSHSAVMSSVASSSLEGTPVRIPLGSASTTSTRDKTKEKKEKGVGLIRRFTSIKKSKSPPPTAYSMDNPVFEDGTTVSPSHPIHVRSGSCPSQLLQVVPLDGSTAHHRLFGSGSQRLKHKDRPNVIMANLAHFGRASDPGTASGGSTNQHRKSNSLDAGSGDPSRKSKQLVPPVRERFRCIVPYPPNGDNELELQVGDIIYVHKKNEDGWYKGTQQRTGRTGLFPASFVVSF